MAQFDIRRNPDSRSRDRYPYLIELQSDVLTDLPTRVMAPLRPLADGHLPPIGRLNPVIDLDDGRFVVVTQELASGSAGPLGPVVGHAGTDRAALTAAWDLMFKGF